MTRITLCSFVKKNKNNVIQKTASQLLTVVEGVTYMRKI